MFEAQPLIETLYLPAQVSRQDPLGQRSSLSAKIGLSIFIPEGMTEDEILVALHEQLSPQVLKDLAHEMWTRMHP